MFCLKKGTDCRLSESGHKNFYYPSRTKTIRVSDDAMVDIMPWLTYDSGLIPVKINNRNLLASEDIIFDRTHSVVWVLEEDIK